MSGGVKLGDDIISGIDDVAPVVDDVAGFLGKFGGKIKGLGGKIKGSDWSPWSNTPKGYTGLGKVIPGLKRVAGIGGIAAPLGLGLNLLMRGDAPKQDFDFSQVPSLSGGGTDAAIDAYTKAQMDILKQYGSGGGGGVARPADMSNAYNYLTGTSTTMGAATLDKMRKLAEANVRRATGIRAGGEAGASNVNKIYGDAAAEIMNASRMKGVEGSALTPVSGTLARLPESIQATGATLGDYLRANQLVSAQDAGFLAELAASQGGAYARDIARQDQTFRMADQARRQAAYRSALAGASSANRAAMQQIALEGAKLKFQNKLSGGGAGVDPSLIDLPTISSKWKTISKDPQQKALWAQLGVTTPEQYLDRQIKAASQASGQ